MDGWETRRRRTPGYDWCIVRLGLPGILCGVVVDTSFFTGNYPERFSLEGCDLGDGPPFRQEKQLSGDEDARWTLLIPETPLKGDSRNSFPVSSERRFTHLRLKIYPDGGVARLRVHGVAVSDAQRTAKKTIDLVAVENGGTVVTSSDEFYGAPRNLLMPYAAKNMGDGWETKRRRGPGHDWVVLKLGVPGTIERIVVDTAHFKGNFPESCSLDACFAKIARLDAVNIASQDWQEILPMTKLKANHRHIFKVHRHTNAATHVRFQIYPDGGVSRLRVFGKPETAETSADGLARYNHLPRRTAIKSVLDCCGCKKWAEQLAALRPFATRSQLFEASDKIWNALSHDHWVEAFRHHPPIGGKQAAAKQAATASRWSSSEQSTAQVATSALLTALADGNRTYATKFGYIFLICATGKTSEEILQAMQQRMSNNPETEVRVAAEEQRKITRLRLEKLLNS